jgi:hypothetical protein
MVEAINADRAARPFLIASKNCLTPLSRASGPAWASCGVALALSGAARSSGSDQVRDKLAFAFEDCSASGSSRACGARMTADSMRSRQRGATACWRRNSLSGSRGKPPREQSSKPLATPAMPPAELGSEKADKLTIAKMVHSAASAAVRPRVTVGFGI